ncbi:MAG: winged helix-turn-helix transcriptional regulator [Candidatus Aenigmarchaeota archaeon]|nr:winged helix-turn-helix transcriptional regulator [Candidatus Aenigmarchaeota archaeon]
MAKYPRIADDIRERIKKGEFEPDKKLPSISKFCDEYKISSATAQKAIGVLKGEGLVWSVPTQGIYLSNGKAISSRYARACEIEQTLRERLMSRVYGYKFPSTRELMSEFEVGSYIALGVIHNLERSKSIYRPSKYGKIYTSEEAMKEYWALFIMEMYPHITRRGELAQIDPPLYRRLMRYGHVLNEIMPAA